MADSTITLTSENCTQINPLNLDIHKISRYIDEKFRVRLPHLMNVG